MSVFSEILPKVLFVMTTIPQPRAPYRNQSANVNNGGDFGGKQLCLIVGLVCLAGFAVDMMAIALPPNPFDLPWRVGFLQQVGDRGIIFLFGSALLLYSQLGNRRLTRPLSLILLGIGVAFMLSSVLVIRDSLILKEQALDNISNQSQQLQSQIEVSKQSPELPPEITLEQFNQASQQVASQTELLKQNAKNGITKAGLASIGNLIVTGMGIAGLGRFGLKSARQISRG